MLRFQNVGVFFPSKWWTMSFASRKKINDHFKLRNRSGRGIFKWVFSSFKSWQETTSGKIRLAFFSSCSDCILSKPGSELWVKDQGPFLKHHILQNSISAGNHTERENWSVDTFQARVSHQQGTKFFKSVATGCVYVKSWTDFFFSPEDLSKAVDAGGRGKLSSTAGSRWDGEVPPCSCLLSELFGLLIF